MNHRICDMLGLHGSIRCAENRASDPCEAGMGDGFGIAIPARFIPGEVGPVAVQIFALGSSLSFGLREHGCSS
jgi:hypothetical protein